MVISTVQTYTDILKKDRVKYQAYLQKTRSVNKVNRDKLNAEVQSNNASEEAKIKFAHQKMLAAKRQQRVRDRKKERNQQLTVNNQTQQVDELLKAKREKNRLAKRRELLWNNMFKLL